MELFRKLGEPFLSKLMDKFMDFAFNNKDEATFESLQSNIRSLHAKACDVNEEIKKLELFGKRKRKREVDDWLEQVQTIENELGTIENEIQMEGFLKQFFGGGRATKLEARVNKLVEQSRHFGELVLDLNDIKGETLLTKKLVGEEFEKNLEKIVRLLLVDRVSSIGICGMGGVGKTTLAKHINNRLLEQTQDLVAWITISQEFTTTMLQDEIAKFVGLDLSNEHNEDKRASRLNRALSKRNNLVLIFDDVWKNINLTKLGDPLSVVGCRLLLTTRSQKVCHRIGCRAVIEVTTLKENEAWKLFEETLGQDVNLTLEVQQIAKLMVRVCNGLPLGIITIAGSMKGETHFDVWSDALAELRESTMEQEGMGDYVFKALKHSFDRLNQREGRTNEHSKFQLCFLYCSLYPEDYPIERRELIRKFILEEFLDKRESRKALFVQGHVILDSLVNVCLLERVDDDHVKMHDLVRAMALKISKGKTKVIAGHHYSLNEILLREEWAKDLERLSLMNSRIETIPDGVSPNCPNLSTLLFEHNRLTFIPTSFFLQMRSICILDLSWTNIQKLPDSLSDMESLKALLLTSCDRLEYVPYLGKLKELRELSLTNTRIQETPQGMEELFNLKFLALDASRNLKMLPKGLLLKFPYLQCLYLPFNIPAPVEEIQKLKHLEEFRGRVRDACDYNRLIIKRPSLAYHIRVKGTPYLYPEFIGYNQLEIALYDFNSREDNSATLLAQDIQHLFLRSCKGLSNCLVDDLPRLNNPVSIQRLYILGCSDIECLSRIEQFQSRVTLTSTIASPPPHSPFSSLSVLDIFMCKNLKKIGLPATQLQTLKELQIQFCEMIEEIVRVNEDIGRGESAQTFAVSLPKLEHLFLQGLPRLKSICKATMICSSIQSIVLQRCLGLQKLPLVFGQPNFDSPPSALKEITLMRDEKEWWEKLELGQTSHHSLLQPFITFEQECQHTL